MVNEMVSGNETIRNEVIAARDSIVFLLLAGTSNVSLNPGISAAGATTELTRLTPVVDSEIIFSGNCLSLDVPPMTPEGIPTPAIVTRACLDRIGVKVIIVDAGLAATPKVPFISGNIGASLDPSIERALPDFQKALNFGKYVGTLISGYKVVFLGESVPGGTTTAQAVMKCVGNNFNTSSSLPSDPEGEKHRLIKKAQQRLGDTDLKADQCIAEYGDYMMPVALGISSVLQESTLVYCGGTQMANVFSLDRMLNKPTAKRYVATTKWVMDHRPETMKKLVESENLIISNIDFTTMPHQGLREYENGHVREGAGMGGAFALYSILNGNMKALYNDISNLYERLSS